MPSGPVIVNKAEDGRKRVFSLRKLFRQSPEVEIARALYATTILAARRSEFYLRLEVPDTAEGRFEMLAICAFLVLHRLKHIEDAKDLSQAYFDVMFDDIDANLRELGVGDLSVGKKVKKLAESFYGRIKAFETGLAEENDTHLRETLLRTLFRDSTPSSEAVRSIAAYMRAEAENLNQQENTSLLTGNVSFLAQVQGRGEQGE